MTDSVHGPLPIPGYVAQSADRLAIVTENKVFEERILRQLDQLANDSAVDKRWLAIGRTGLEQAFMAINRAVFKPTRASLPEDEIVAVAQRVAAEAGAGTIDPAALELARYRGPDSEL